MSIFDGAFMDTQLSKRGLRLWVVIGILVGALIVFALFLLSLCLTSRRHRRRAVAGKLAATLSKEIQEIVHLPGPHMLRQPQAPAPTSEIHVDIRKVEHRVVFHSDSHKGISSDESKGTVSGGCETTSSFGSGSVVLGGVGLLGLKFHTWLGKMVHSERA